jgi:cytochrome c553
LSAAAATNAEPVGTPPEAAATCVACHGKNGVGTMDEYPNLAGQHADYLAQALNDYRLGRRKNPIMQPFAQQLTQDEIHALAEFYASQKGLKTLQRD